VTEHGLVLYKYRYTVPLQKKKPANCITKFNIELLKNQSARLLYESRLKEKISNTITTEDTVNEAWNKLRSNIENGAKEAIGVRTINTNGRKTNKPWFTPEVKTLAAEKKTAYIKYKNNRTPEEYQIYKQVRTRVNEQMKQLGELLNENATRFIRRQKKNVDNNQKQKQNSQ
jgi:hypothetical protein